MDCFKSSACTVKYPVNNPPVIIIVSSLRGRRFLCILYVFPSSHNQSGVPHVFSQVISIQQKVLNTNRTTCSERVLWKGSVNYCVRAWVCASLPGYANSSGTYSCEKTPSSGWIGNYRSCLAAAVLVSVISVVVLQNVHCTFIKCQFHLMVWRPEGGWEQNQYKKIISPSNKTECI